MHSTLLDTMRVQAKWENVRQMTVHSSQKMPLARYSVARDSHEDVIGIHGKEVHNDNSD